MNKNVLEMHTTNEEVSLVFPEYYMTCEKKTCSCNKGPGQNLKLHCSLEKYHLVCYFYFFGAFFKSEEPISSTCTRIYTIFN